METVKEQAVVAETSQANQGNLPQTDLGQVASAMDVVSLRKMLKLCSEHRKLLEEQLAISYKEIWKEALECLAQALPHQELDGSANQRAYAILRHRILKVGNDKIRDLDSILGDYMIEQIFTRTVSRTVVAKENTPHGLPRGVKIRPQASR